MKKQVKKYNLVTSQVMHMCTFKKAFTIATIMLILVCLATHVCLTQVKDHIATH